MPVRVQIPGAFRVHTGGLKTVEVEGATVADALLALTTAHPQLKAHLYGIDGGLRRYMNVFLNDEDIRSLGHLATPLRPTDTLVLIPAMSGG